MDKIKIDKLTVFGKHGVYPEENVLGQKFEVSLVLYTDTRKAGLTDNLECSINYGDVCHYVKQFFEENTFQLIERVAEKLAEELLLRYDLLQKVDVKIEKPWAPILLPVENVGVEISRGWHTAYIALGSNMGNKKAYLDEAVEKLKNHHGKDAIRVFRPADADETTVCWAMAMENMETPTALIFSRQNIAKLPAGTDYSQARKGAYIVAGSDEDYDVILVISLKFK